MPGKNVITSILILFIVTIIPGILCAGFYANPQTAGNNGGPPLGQWEFIGKDDKGAEWKGTLKIETLDANHIVPGINYRGMCDFDMESEGSKNGVSSQFLWDPDKRELSASLSGIAEYTAILSADGKSLMQGKFTQWHTDHRSRKVTVERTGTWSAKFLKP